MVLTEDQKKQVAVMLRRKKMLELRMCIDPAKPSSRPSPPQQAILEDTTSLHVYVVAGNQSGKSQIGGRVTAWKFNDDHPYWKRDPEWGDEPLLIIVAGRIGDQVEELWQRKIKPYLPVGSYNTPSRIGTVLKSVTHSTSGNKIIFTSHEKASSAWEKIQSYVAHHVWIDEMPSDSRYLEEAHRRVDARQGQVMVTMTPKSKNEKIRNMIDNVDPRIGKKYMMGKLDNPIYWGREELEIAKLAFESEERRNCILYGHWMGGEESVFEFERDKHIRDLPPNYDRNWPHILGFDPAAKGMGGLVILGYNAEAKQWHVVVAEYIQGKAPSVLVELIRTKASKYNIVRKVYDVHEGWFHDEAIVRGYKGWIAVDKHHRKKALITGLQQALWDGWLVSIDGLTEMTSEYRDAEWLDGDQAKIRNSTRFHILDAMQYTIDNLPKEKEVGVKLTRDAAIMKAHQETLEYNQKVRNAKKGEKVRLPPNNLFGRRMW